jgi:MFS family permease
LTFILTFLSILIGEFFELNLTNWFLLFSIIRSVSLIGLLFGDFNYKSRLCKDSSHRTETKQFLYYLIPWAIFISVGILAWNLIPRDTFSSAVAIGSIFRFSCIAIFGFLSGFVGDRIGRKTPIIAGLLVMAFGFFILGVFGISNETVILYLTTSGVAWGAFFTIYSIIPGDLSTCGSREKLYFFYVVVIFLLMPSLPYLPGMADLTSFTNSFAQILSFILILAIIPIWRARETLSSDVIKQRELQEHLKKAVEFQKKIKDK